MGLASAVARAFIDNRQAVRDAIVNSCPLPMFAADMDGQWMYANEMYLKLLGIPLERAIGDGWRTSLHASCSESVIEVYARVIGEQSAARHVPVVHQQSTGHAVHGFMDVAYAPGSGFVGWFAPVCVSPVDCPLHGLLGNIPRLSWEQEVAGLNPAVRTISSQSYTKGLPIVSAFGTMPPV